jgi:integrase
MEKTYHELTLQESGFKKIPELFDRDDFSKMISAIEKGSIYPVDPYWNFWMKERDKCILAMLFYTGCRPKEICSLRYDDFKPKLMAFHIRGENNKQKKDRIVPIVEPLVPFIQSYLKYGRRSNYIFPSYENISKPLSSGRWKTIMREKILKPSGLWIAPVNTTVPRTRSYSFRAGYGTELLKQTGDPGLVAAMLGHSDWRSLKRYIFLNQITDNNLQRVRNAFKTKKPENSDINI